MEVDLAEDNVPATGTSDGNSQKSTRIRGVPTGYRTSTFVNEANQDKEVPLKRCAVCCKLLYKEDCYVLSKDDRRKVEVQFVQDRLDAQSQGASPEVLSSMTWPLLNYRDHRGMMIDQLDVNTDGKNSGTVVVCARHKSKGAQDLETIFKYVRPS